MFKNKRQSITFVPHISTNMNLHNKYGKDDLTKRVERENFERTTLSFYKYMLIGDPESMRSKLYEQLNELKVLGRIYIAREGINAQINVPTPVWDEFVELIEGYKELKGVLFKIAVEEKKTSFLKLIVRIREKIVADGLNDQSFDVTNVGNHLSAMEFNKAIEEPGTIVVDVRNHYESEVGHFKTAILPEADTFKDTIPRMMDELKDKKDNKILLYCTGGIRCEKASAYLKYSGFSDVNQLHGGIISYAHQVKELGMESAFIGKNFVFDDRLGEKITHDIISECHQCGEPCDSHTNCVNDDCHLLFLQCAACKKKYEGCCTKECRDIINLPIEEQRKRRKGKNRADKPSVYSKGRIRPRLDEFMKEKRKA